MADGTIPCKYRHGILDAVSAQALVVLRLLFWHESTHVTLRHWKLDLPNWQPKGETPVRIALLADFHPTSWGAVTRCRKAVAMALEQKPDLALIAGDFELLEKYSGGLQEALRPLLDKLPVFACLGNHDYIPEKARRGRMKIKEDDKLATAAALRRRLESWGMRLLVNEKVSCQVRERELEVVGLGDWWQDDMKPSLCMNAETDGPHDKLVLLLSHNPDTSRLLLPYAWDVQFSGHAHGGQLKLPFCECYPFAPLDDKRLARPGLHEIAPGRFLCETSGVGGFLGIRINSPPDVTILDIT